jgi:hypothetical protein
MYSFAFLVGAMVQPDVIQCWPHEVDTLVYATGAMDRSYPGHVEDQRAS